MPHAPNLRVAFEDWRLPLFPVLEVADVAALKFEQAQAIFGRPTAGRRIDDKELAVPLENLRPFADIHFYLFPWVFRRGEESSFATDGPRVGHGRDVKVL